MILNKLNQYKNLYLQASNENAHLKHAVSKHEDELEANRKTIDSMDSRILELEENQKEWDKEKAQLQSQRDCYKKERDEERESHSQTKKELAKAKEEITKLQESKEAKELSEQANVDLHSVVLVLQRRLFKTNSDASSYMKGLSSLSFFSFLLSDFGNLGSLPVSTGVWSTSSIIPLANLLASSTTSVNSMSFIRRSSNSTSPFI